LTQRILRLLSILGNKQQIEGRATINEELPLAVDNHSSRAGNSLDAHAVILRQKCVPFTINHLEEKEPG
jgi:hypothetical protein